MSVVIPIVVTLIAFGLAYQKLNPPGPRPFSFGAVDIFGFFEAVFLYGAAALASLMAWVSWLSWMAFT